MPRPNRAVTLAAAVLVVVAAAGCANRSQHPTADAPTATPDASAGPNSGPGSAAPSDTSATGGNPASTPGKPSSKPPSKQPTPVVTTPPPAPTVTHVALSADSTSYTGIYCPHTFSFTGTISVSRGPVTVSYAWRASNWAAAITGSVHFGPGGPQHATVHSPMSAAVTAFDTSSRSWMSLRVTAPNTLAAPNANVFLDCVPPTTDLAVHMPGGPGACGGHVTTTSFVVDGLANKPLQYTIEWGDGTHETGSTTRVPPLRGSVVASHHTYASGTYTLHVWAGAASDSGMSGDSQSQTFTCS